MRCFQKLEVQVYYVNLAVYLICTLLLYKRCASVGHRLGLSSQGRDGVIRHASREMVIMLLAPKIEILHLEIQSNKVRPPFIKCLAIISLFSMLCSPYDQSIPSFDHA